MGLVCDKADLDEALVVLGRWANRAGELPRRLRDEIEALARTPGEVNDVRREGSRLVIGPSARLLALVANLRAQEAGLPR